MTKEQAISKLLEMRFDVLKAFKDREWITLHTVAQHVDAHIIEAMETHHLIEVKVGHIKPTTFRVKAEGYRLATQYR